MSAEPRVDAEPRPERPALQAIERFVSGGAFPAFALALLLFYEVLLIAILLTPAGETGLGAFAEEFRIWCFGSRAGEVDAAWVAAMLVPPLLIGVFFALLWWEPLRDRITSPLGLLPPVGTALGFTLAAAGAFAALGSAPDADDLPFPAEALRTAHRPPELRLRDQSGARIELDALRGKVVLLTGVYASCPHACPLILSQARRAIEAIPAEQRADLELVAVTLDPKHDSMEVLAELARQHGLDADTYHLVSGEPAEVERILDEMELIRRRDPKTGVIDHANLFLLLDRGGKVAYRLTLGERQERWLVSALQTLLSEPAGSS